MVDAVSTGNLASTQLNTNPGTAETDARTLADDFDNFLLLLTTQLQNQDPTEPLDVNQMTNQLVAFTGVEQQVKTNSLLEDFVKTQQGSGFDEAVQYIGNFVDAVGRAGELRASDGLASFSYSLAKNATDVDVVITNSAGRAVFTGQGSGQAGKNFVSWDGKNSFTGAQEVPGTYFISITAKDSSNNVVEATTYTTGIARGAHYNSQKQLVLTVAGTEVALENVIAVRQPPAENL